MWTLELASGVREAMVADARAGAPAEVCGVLGGSRAVDPRRVERAEPVPNVARESDRRYELDPEAQLRAMEGFEADGLDVVGFYHSHPRGPRRPSATDEAQATWPDASYAIVSLGDEHETVGSWRWTGERFEPERVRVV